MNNKVKVVSHRTCGYRTVKPTLPPSGMAAQNSRLADHTHGRGALFLTRAGLRE